MHQDSKEDSQTTTDQDSGDPKAPTDTPISPKVPSTGHKHHSKPGAVSQEEKAITPVSGQLR